MSIAIPFIVTAMLKKVEYHILTLLRFPPSQVNSKERENSVIARCMRGGTYIVECIYPDMYGSNRALQETAREMIQVDATLIDITFCVVSQPSPLIPKKVASQHHDAVSREGGVPVRKARGDFYEKAENCAGRRPTFA